MNAVFLASLKKELREALRDKRALFLTVLMPLVFYPAMVGGNVWMQLNHQKKQAERALSVGVIGEVETGWLPTEQIRWSRVDGEDVVSILNEGHYDLLIECDGSQMRLHYHSGQGGRSALHKVEQALETYRKRAVEEKLRELGVDTDVLTPFEIQSEDHATARQQQSGEVGGVGAYFLVFLALTGCMAVAIDTASGEKERGTLESMLATPASFAALAAGKLVYIVLMGCLSVFSTFLGILALAFLWWKMGTGLYEGGMDAWSGLSIELILGALGQLIAMVFLFASLLFGISIMARSTKEAHMRSVLLMLLVAMSLVYSTLPGIAIGGNVMWVPVLNISLVLRGLWEGSLSGADYWLVLAMTLGLALLVLLSVSRAVRRNPEKVLLKQ